MILPLMHTSQLFAHIDVFFIRSFVDRGPSALVERRRAYRYLNHTLLQAQSFLGGGLWRLGPASSGPSWSASTARRGLAPAPASPPLALAAVKAHIADVDQSCCYFHWLRWPDECVGGKASRPRDV